MIIEAGQSEPHPYRPSNSTEGEWFMSRWCYGCAAYGESMEESPCEILGDALAGGEPAEWRDDGPKGPRCTAFRENPDDPGPLDPAAVIRPLL